MIIDQNLRITLEKQIPALREQVRRLYTEYDRRFGLKGAAVPVTFGMETDVLGYYAPGGEMHSAMERFHFSLLFVGSYAERAISKEDRLDIFKHEYAHYMQRNMPIPKEYMWKAGKHGSDWKYCCSLVGAAPTEYYRAGDALIKHDYDKILKNIWKDPNIPMLDIHHREQAYKKDRDSRILYQAGQTVTHPKFGEGVITGIEPKDGSVRLKIRFRNEEKMIDQKWLKRSTFKKPR